MCLSLCVLGSGQKLHKCISVFQDWWSELFISAFGLGVTFLALELLGMLLAIPLPVCIIAFQTLFKAAFSHTDIGLHFTLVSQSKFLHGLQTAFHDMEAVKGYPCVGKDGFHNGTHALGEIHGDFNHLLTLFQRQL